MTVRLPAATIALLACLLLATPAAHAKEGVRATLEHPERLRDAEPGERIALAWRLHDAAGRPFGADGIYLRVRAAAGGASRVVAARALGAGRFVADLTIPAGGVASIGVGLEGIRMVPGRPPERADMSFPVVNAPRAATAADTAASPLWVVIVALGALAAATWARRSRRSAAIAR